MLLLNRNSVLDTPKTNEQTHLTDPSSTTDRLCIGLDVGTASIVSGIRQADGQEVVEQEKNAFFSVPDHPKTLEFLTKQKIKFLQKGRNIYILGNKAEKAADLFKKNTQRPVKNGLLNPNEPDGVEAIMEILKTMIPADQREGTPICFSIPADPIGQEGAVVYHSAMMRMHLKSLGFEPKSVNEGLAVILSETDTSDATA